MSRRPSKNRTAGHSSRSGSNRTPSAPPPLAFDFMRYRRAAAILSLSLVLASVLLLTVRGLNFGLDFTGGTLVEVAYSQSVSPDDVRATLTAAGYDEVVVQNFGSDADVLVRLPVLVAAASLGDQILADLRTASTTQGQTISLRRIEFVGPAVGEELRQQGALAILCALVLVMLYIMFRFLFKFAAGAVVALAHDVILTLGAFSLFQWDFNLPVLASILAVIGYSLNDTIVVSDRLRENFRRLRQGTPVSVINISLNQVWSRTIVTSMTTLFVLLSLALFGGELIFGFAMGLIVGVVVGTYSSIYVATNMLLLMRVERQDLLLPEKEGVSQDGMP